MIPLRIHRALIVLFAVSAFIGLLEESLEHFGASRDLAKIASGVFTGFMVFVLAYEGGRILRFCGKGLVDDPERRAKVRAALFDIGILEERRSGKRRKEGIRNLELHGERRLDGSPAKMLMYVSVVDSDRFIAITVNQGKTHRAFISTRMVDAMTPAALRGVLAHEYGHVCHFHPFKQATLLGLVASVKLSIGVPLGAVAVILLSYLFMLRSWEYVADAAAVVRTSPDDVLAAFSEYQEIAGETNMSVWSEFFSGHPSLHRRIAAITQPASNPS